MNLFPITLVFPLPDENAANTAAMLLKRQHKGRKPSFSRELPLFPGLSVSDRRHKPCDPLKAGARAVIGNIALSDDRRELTVTLSDGKTPFFTGDGELKKIYAEFESALYKRLGKESGAAGMILAFKTLTSVRSVSSAEMYRIAVSRAENGERTAVPAALPNTKAELSYVFPAPADHRAVRSFCAAAAKDEDGRGVSVLISEQDIMRVSVRFIRKNVCSADGQSMIDFVGVPAEFADGDCGKVASRVKKAALFREFSLACLPEGTARSEAAAFARSLLKTEAERFAFDILNNG